MQKCFQNLPRTLPKPSEIVPNSEKIDHKTQERAQDDPKTSNKRPRREKMTKNEPTWANLALQDRLAPPPRRDTRTPTSTP